MGLEKYFSVGDVRLTSEELHYNLSYSTPFLGKPVTKRFGEIEDISNYLKTIRYDRLVISNDVNVLLRTALRHVHNKPNKIVTEMHIEKK